MAVQGNNTYMCYQAIYALESIHLQCCNNRAELQTQTIVTAAVQWINTSHCGESENISNNSIKSPTQSPPFLNADCADAAYREGHLTSS